MYIYIHKSEIRQDLSKSKKNWIQSPFTKLYRGILYLAWESREIPSLGGWWSWWSQLVLKATNYSRSLLVIPSDNQTWIEILYKWCLNGKKRLYINGAFSVAMFDYWSIRLSCVVFLFWWKILTCRIEIVIKSLLASINYTPRFPREADCFSTSRLDDFSITFGNFTFFDGIARYGWFKLYYYGIYNHNWWF